MSNKSEVMRKMYDDGMSVSQISKKMNCHYSYVYGVIQRYCNKQGIEMRREKKETKSDVIRKMYDDGMKVGQIAKQLNSNYSFVFSVVKKYRESKESKEQK